MTQKYTIGIDVGGSSTKSAIYTLQGKVVGEGKANYQPVEPRKGVAEYNATEILDAVDESLKIACDHPILHCGLQIFEGNTKSQTSYK